MNEIKIIDHRPYTIRRVFSKLCMIISRSAMFPSSVRTRILKLGGIKISGWCFVGAGVHFDEMRPDLIEIGEGSTITGGSHIISHFYNPCNGRFYYGRVNIGKKVFIGMNTLIINAVNIGDKAVIGAGSVVTKDIPAGELWGGNPARFIKKIEFSDADED